MRWFVTGDTHGNFERIYNWIEKLDFNNIDINIIIAGDAGICWRKDKKDLNQIIQLHEDNYNFHIWFIDGNHENFDVLKEFQPDEYGIVNLSSHIHYFPRGSGVYIQTDNGTKSILCCGGADSVDKTLRTPHIGWWADEAITFEDIDKCLAHKKDVDKFDYVITHCCPYSIFLAYSAYLITLTSINQKAVDHSSELMLDNLANEINFDKWYFGHYHVDKQLTDKYRCVLNDFIEL